MSAAINTLAPGLLMAAYSCIYREVNAIYVVDNEAGIVRNDTETNHLLIYWREDFS